MRPTLIARALTTALLCCVFASAGALAQDDPQAMTVHDVARLRSVGGVVISPDGALIAYTLSVPRDLEKEDDGGAWSELHVVDAAGESRGYVTGKAIVGGVAWVDAGRI